MLPLLPPREHTDAVVEILESRDTSRKAFCVHGKGRKENMPGDYGDRNKVRGGGFVIGEFQGRKR